MKTFLLGAAFATVAAGVFAMLLAAQDLPPLADGSGDGDPPFLLETAGSPS